MDHSSATQYQSGSGVIHRRGPVGRHLRRQGTLKLSIFSSMALIASRDGSYQSLTSSTTGRPASAGNLFRPLGSRATTVR
jgi:hypothetical protein